MNTDINELQNEAIAAAAEHIREQRKKNAHLRLIICCLTVLLIVAMICATVLGVTAICKQQQTIIEQQYALNMQYAGLLDLMSGAEITSEYVDTGDGDNGTAFIGDGNTVAGGDLNG